MDIDVTLEDPRWADLGLEGMAEQATLAVLTRLGIEPEDCAVSVLGCDDARIATLNADFRGKPMPTNVLSWPAEERGADEPGATPEPPEADPFGTIELGDIAIAYDTCDREAREAGKPLADHAMHLLVHGVLHLLGYDHERDSDATLMEGLESEILGKMGLPDPYTA